MTDPAAGDPRPDAVRVLVAEDEPHLGTLLEQFLIGRGHAVTLVRDGRAALAALRAHDFDVALTDVQMPGPDGLALLAAARALPLGPEVIVATGNGAAETALRALRAGAYDAVAKPYRMVEVELLVQRAAEKRALRRAVAAARVAGAPPLDDPALMALARALGDAGVDAPLLLVGEPGTGRRSLARALHERAARAGAFLVVDGAAVTRETLLDGTADAPPLIALARGGTLCVARAERLEAGITAALPDRAREARCAVALLASAPVELPGHAALRAATLAPLRRRAADVPTIAAAVAARVAGRALPLAPATARALCERGWPGNLAELAAVVTAAVARAGADAAALEPAALDPAD